VRKIPAAHPDILARNRSTGIMSETLREEVRRFVLPRFEGHELGDDENFFALGLINSLFAMELVVYIEQLVGIPVPNAELRLENLQTIDNIVRLAERLGRTARPAPTR
jgi:methoxymalonate biosynthesis acyl carrier protein